MGSLHASCCRLPARAWRGGSGRGGSWLGSGRSSRPCGRSPRRPRSPASAAAAAGGRRDAVVAASAAHSGLAVARGACCPGARSSAGSPTRCTSGTGRLVVLLPIVLGHPLGLRSKAVVLVGSVVVAALTTLLVEEPRALVRVGPCPPAASCRARGPCSARCSLVALGSEHPRGARQVQQDQAAASSRATAGR